MSDALDRIKEWRAHYEMVRRSLGPAIHIAWGDPASGEPGSLLLADLDAVLSDLDRLTAERDAARDALEPIMVAVANVQGRPLMEWMRDVLAAAEAAALTPPTDQGEGA